MQILVVKMQIAIQNMVIELVCFSGEEPLTNQWWDINQLMHGRHGNYGREPRLTLRLQVLYHSSLFYFSHED